MFQLSLQSVYIVQVLQKLTPLIPSFLLLLLPILAVHAFLLSHYPLVILLLPHLFAFAQQLNVLLLKLVIQSLLISQLRVAVCLVSHLFVQFLLDKPATLLLA